MEIVPFKKEHIAQITEQAAMAWLRPHFEGTDYGALEGPGAFTGIDRAGVVQACIGIIQHWPGRGEAWAFMGDNCRHVLPDIHRACVRWLRTRPYDRIDAVVARDFAAGHRWVRMLGFELEAPLLRKYLPGGVDAALYAKVY